MTDLSLRANQRRALAGDQDAEERLRHDRCRSDQCCACSVVLGATEQHAIRCSDEWLMEDSRTWSYCVTAGPHGLELRSEEVIHLKRGPELDALRWILNRYAETGELPGDPRA